mgnify:CR=1 FL=1
MCENNYCQSASIPNVKHLVNAKFLLVAALGLIPFDLNQFLRHKKVLVKIKGEQFKVFSCFKQRLLLQSILEVCIESMTVVSATGCYGGWLA